MNDDDGCEEELGNPPTKAPMAHALPDTFESHEFIAAPVMKTEVLRIQIQKAVTKEAAAKK